MTRGLLRLIDSCLPPDLVRAGNLEQLYRCRALSGTLLLAGAYTLVLTPLAAWMQRDDPIYLLLVAPIGPLAIGIIGICLWMLRRGQPPVLVGNFFMAMCWLPLVVFFLVTGGFPRSPMMLFLLVHPVQGFLTAGPRSALFWSVLSVVTVGVLSQVDAATLVPQVSMQVVELVHIMTWVACSMVLFTCFWFFDLINRRLAESIGRERDLAGFAAAHDSLTGLMNRSAFGRRIESALERGQQLERPLALLLIDLDGFKAVNDSLGHHAGDHLLCELARRMRATMRDSDVVARIGGDEFAVLLEGMSEGESLQRVIAQLLRVLSETVDCDGHAVAVSASIGVALSPQDGRDAESLQRSADRAMYAAKASGRSAAMFYHRLAIAP